MGGKGTAGKINELIKQIAGSGKNLPIAGVVTKIDGDTCTVKIAEDFEIEDVKLKATIGDDQFIIMKPSLGSNVLMLSLSGTLENLTIIKFDKVDQVHLIQNQLEILADASDNKVMLKNDKASMFDLMQDLVDLLKQFQVFTNSGASGYPIPKSIEKITAFEAKFKELLK